MNLKRCTDFLFLTVFILTAAACQDGVLTQEETGTPPDTTGPSVEITSPTGQADYAAPLAFVGLAGTASDNTSVVSVTWVNSRGGQGTATGTTIWSADSIPLANGDNLITVTAADADGNTASDQIVVTYENNPSSDVTPPDVSITTPTSAAEFNTNQPGITVAGTATDNTLISSVRWVNNRGGQGSATGTSAWSADSITLAAGENRITITAEDPAGNSASDVIVITYSTDPSPDLTPPEVVIVSPTRSTEFVSDSPSVSLGGTANDNIAVDSVSWSNNRGGQGVATGRGNWAIAAVTLQSGDNRITVTARDDAGNSASDVLTVRYTAQGDTVDPLIEITSPTDSGSFTTDDDSVVVAGVASDNTGLTEVTWQVNGGVTSAAVGLQEWSTPVILLESGANQIRVAAIDAAGNEAFAEITVTQQIAQPDVLRGIAIIGDSNADEYRANDNRGGIYANTTLNWVEQLVRYRGLNFGAWGSRGSPRRGGYEYNWALSGATASSMISSGQHNGVAQQVAAGEVTLVLIDIGFNDFARERYAEIYSGGLSGSSLSNKVNGIVDDITLAVDTIQAAGSAAIVVAGIYDYEVNLPNFIAAFPDAARRQSVTNAIRSLNVALQQMTSQRGVAYVDQAAVAAALYATATPDWFLEVGGELIDLINPGNEPHHGRLNDASQHMGTVSSALYFANGVFIPAINGAYGTAIVPFSDAELLNAAGISP